MGGSASKQTSKCDVIRDMERMMECGGCRSKACATTADCPAGQTCSDGACIGRPSICPSEISSQVCRIPGAANLRMKAFADRYSMAPLVMGATARQQRELEDRIYASNIQDTEQSLAAAYPNASAGAVKISWPDIGECKKLNPPGSDDAAHYFGRAEMLAYGMKPTYPLGGEFASGAVWRDNPSPLPAAVDYLANPDLFAIVIFVFLVLLAVALFLSRRASRTPSAVPAATQQKCLEYVLAQEARGYPMGYYRARCGLPLVSPLASSVALSAT